MVTIATIALYGWVPFVLLVFAVLPPRRAVIFAYVGGWLFLPMLRIKFPGIPDLDKITASSFGILLGASIFDGRALLRFRPRWYDLPMGLWCCAPFVTSQVNGLGVYDGGANIVSQLGVWGIPYFVGRVYFKDLDGFKELGLGIVIGAIAYLPMCYVEMVISPTLHQKLYGFVQHSLAMSKRWGGYRPMVFMQSGLALAMYMTFATLLAGWMWMSGTVRTLFGVPMLAVVGVLFFTQVVVCKTMAATMFMFVGMAALVWIRLMRNMPGLVAGLPVLVLVAVPPTYMYLRSSGLLDADAVSAAAGTIASEDRLQSLGVRLQAEDKVVAKAFDAPNPWWGWGKWDPNQPGITPWRVYTESMKIAPDGLEYRQLKDTAVTDGLWIIVIGQYGLVGLALLTTAITAPALILWGRVPVRYWGHRAVAPVAAMAVLLVLHMVDNLLNGMINALFMLALGGVSAIGPAVRQVHRRFGPLAAQAVLDQQVGGGSPPAGPAYGAYPMQAYGQHAAPQRRPATPAVGGYDQAFPAAFATYGAAPSSDSGYPAVPGFPAIAGLQAGPAPLPQGQAGRRRRR